MNSFFSRFNLPTRAEIRYALSVLPFKQKVFVGILFVLFISSSIGIIWSLNNSAMIKIAAPGGSFSEGIVGTPRFINPLLAISDADRDMTALVYSGLMRVGIDNKPTVDLAESYTVSEDGLHYTFKLKDGLTWHDGKPVTADDVVFTIGRAQDSMLKSPKRPSWEGVRVTKVNDLEIEFTLKQPYAAFLENATLGILPKHLWNDFHTEAFSLSELNTHPVGTGPYRVTDIKTNDNGIPTSYELKSFKDFALGRPHISKVKIYFYSNEQDLLKAYDKGDVEALSAIDPAAAATLEQDGRKIIRSPLPRIFGVFFNQNQSEVLADASVRKALSLALDRQAIVDNVLKGYGTPLYSPLPPHTAATSTASTTSSLEEAKEILADAGWIAGDDGVLAKKNARLQFSLATSDTPELAAAAELIKNNWEQLGARVELRPYEIGDLNQTVIRPRKYDALFFGEVLGRDPDPFPFWHSSQRLDPGLNIAMYTNSKADDYLEKIRSTSEETERAEALANFIAEVEADHPAAFVYAPDFIYIVPEKIKRSELPIITIPAERFLNVHNWYIKTDKVWKIFADNHNTINLSK